MKKENILVFVLIVIAVLGIGFYFKTRPVSQKGEQAKVIQSNGGLVASAKTSNDKGIDWKEYSDGTALAKAQGKHIFLYFYADW
ncbi:MAG: hypothetical protein ABIJ59_07400 [Pseudomonadota bacterium]